MKKWLKGIRGKLLVAAFLPMLGLGIVIGVSASSSQMLGGLLDESFLRVIPTLMALSDIRAEKGNIIYNAWAARHFVEKDQKLASEHIQSMKKAFADFQAAIKEYEGTQTAKGESEIYEKFKVRKDAFYNTTKEIIKNLELATPESLSAASVMMSGEWRADAELIHNTARDIVTLYDNEADRSDKEQKEARAYAKNLIFFTGLTSMFLIFGLLMWIAYNISNAVGDVAAKLSDSTGQVTQAIEQLSAAGQSLSESSTESAASLEETVASLEEITSMVQMNSDHAREAAGLAYRSREAAEKGETEIQSLVTSMQGISQASKKIEEIIHVIDDIAFQTNLLALNAAVEAARAGEQGKGFAVVADAVRTLAHKSGEAAKDITSLIKDSVEKIDEGALVANKSGMIMEDIVSAVKKVSDLANEIASASSEQTSGIQQISKAMNQLDQGAQSNAASAEEIASTSEEIASQATQMQNLVEKLNSVVVGAIKEAVGEASSTAAVAIAKTKKAKPNVVKFTPRKEPSKNQTMGQAVIPFDEDETSVSTSSGRSKIGDVSGF